MAYCPSCGSEVAADDRFCSRCGRELRTLSSAAPPGLEAPSADVPLRPPATEPTPPPTAPGGGRRRALLVTAAVLLIASIAAAVLIVGSGDDGGEAGHEKVCELTAEFWTVVEGDEDRSELDRLIGIAGRMGDGIDDDAEEEGFDDIAENATEAAIGASFAEATGETGAMFTSLENLERLCADLGVDARDAAPATSQEPDDDAPTDARVEVTPAGHPAGEAIASQVGVRLPDDPFTSVDCDFPAENVEGGGTAYYCVGTQASGRTLEVNAFDDGNEIVWGFALGGPDCEGVSGCTYGNAIDLARLRSDVADRTGADPDDVDCDAGPWPGHRVPPGGRVTCVTPGGETVQAKVISDDEYELVE